MKLYLVDDLNLTAKDRNQKINILNRSLVKFTTCVLYKDPTLTNIHAISADKSILDNSNEFVLIKLSTDIIVSPIGPDTQIVISALQSEIEFLSLSRTPEFHVLRIPPHVSINHMLVSEYYFPLSSTTNVGVPLISAVMVTKNRVNYVKNAVKCFLNQTYPCKELIIVTDNDDETEAYGKELQKVHSNIYVYNYSGEFKLGTLRNMAIKNTNGEYIIQWDDDDYYHPIRMSIMYIMLRPNRNDKKNKFVIMNNWTVAWPQYNKVGIGKSRPWEGSILFNRDLYPQYKYSEESKGEDTYFVKQLLNSGERYTKLDASFAPIYIYGIHGKNTWNERHLRGIMNSCVKDLPDTKGICSNLLPYQVSEVQDYDTSNGYPDPNVFIFFLIAIIIIFCIIIGYIWMGRWY